MKDNNPDYFKFFLIIFFCVMTIGLVPVLKDIKSVQKENNQLLKDIQKQLSDY